MTEHITITPHDVPTPNISRRSCAAKKIAFVAFGAVSVPASWGLGYEGIAVVEETSIVRSCPNLPPADILSSIHTQLELSARHDNPHTLADKLGVKLPDALPPLGEIERAKTPAEATEAVSKFTQASFGFPVTYEYSGKSKFNLPGYKKQLEYFVQAAALLPEDIVRKGAVTGITVTNLSEKEYKKGDNKVVAGAMSMIGPHKMRVDLNYVGDPQTITHEMGHSIQASECSGRRPDRAFTGFNPAGYGYKGSSAGYRHKPNKTVSGTEYGETDEHEDYAETTAVLMVRPETAQEAIAANTPWSHKADVVAERFNRAAPGSVTYLSWEGWRLSLISSKAQSAAQQNPAYIPDLG